MITHNGARTRALYAWEEQDLSKREFVGPVSLIEAYDIAMHFRLCPKISIRPNVGSPYCRGEEIALTEADHTNLTLLHELAHYLVDSRTNHHNEEFVNRYIRYMNSWFGWDIEELELHASWRGLI